MDQRSSGLENSRNLGGRQASLSARGGRKTAKIIPYHFSMELISGFFEGRSQSHQISPQSHSVALSRTTFFPQLHPFPIPNNVHWISRKLPQPRWGCQFEAMRQSWRNLINTWLQPGELATQNVCNCFNSFYLPAITNALRLGH